jgi:hypothetical protein
MKKCSKCLINKPFGDFGLYKNSPDGLKPRCRTCRQEDYAEYLKNPEARKRMLERGVAYNKLNADKIEFNRLKRAYSYKLEIMSHYSNGTPTCSCCGENHIEFLSIDHIDGGGNRQRKDLGISGNVFYEYLKKQGYPTGYRVLCHNCNQARGNFGGCPHKDFTIYTPFK